MRLTPLVPFVVLLMAASCANDAQRSDQGGRWSEPGGPDPALIASCGGNSFDRLPPDTSKFAPFDSFDELDLSSWGGEGSYFLDWAAGYEWFMTREGDDYRQLYGVPLAAEGDPFHGSIRIERQDGKWAPVGSGHCRIELHADGWGNARFVIDPATPPGPEADQISVLATEQSCANGRVPEGRTVRAVIHEQDESSVSIVILVEPGKGFATCQGNPSFPFQVDLDSPLGDREVFDASIFPPQSQWQ